MKSFHQLTQKREKKVIGLMSGTSVDGVDAALVEIWGHGLETQVELLAFQPHPFEATVRDRIFDLFQPETSRVDEICQMNFLIGEVFADAVLAVIHNAQLEVGEIDLIGSHGQTVYHLPPQRDAQYIPSTLQLGEPAVIAYRTGIPTIANFRVADPRRGWTRGTASAVCRFSVVSADRSDGCAAKYRRHFQCDADTRRGSGIRCPCFRHGTGEHDY